MSLFLFLYFSIIEGSLFACDALLPEVGDLQRSSEVLDPSFESQVAAGATKRVIKQCRISPLVLLSERLTKDVPIPTVQRLKTIKGSYLSGGRDIYRYS